MKKNFFIIIFLIFGLVQKSFAYSSDPQQFIQEVVDEAIQKNIKRKNYLNWLCELLISKGWHIIH